MGCWITATSHLHQLEQVTGTRNYAVEFVSDKHMCLAFLLYLFSNCTYYPIDLPNTWDSFIGQFGRVFLHRNNLGMQRWIEWTAKIKMIWTYVVHCSQRLTCDCFEIWEQQKICDLLAYKNCYIISKVVIHVDWCKIYIICYHQ